TGGGFPLDSCPLDRSGSETFRWQRSAQSSWHIVLGDHVSTLDGSSTYNETTNGSDVFAQHQARARQGGNLVTTAFSRDDTGNASFNVQQQGTSAAHTVFDTAGSFADSQDAFSLTKIGSQNFTQHQ